MKLKRFLADEVGAQSIEYGLLALLISTAAFVGMGLVGTALGTLFTNTASNF